MSVPALIAASHGTSDPRGRAAVAALVDAVGGSQPQLAVVGGFVDVQQPDVPGSIAAVGGDDGIVVVPLLLSAGYHVNVDLAEAARGASPLSVEVAPALGPDPRLIALLARRLDEAGMIASDRVVLAAAGSSDPGAVEDCLLVGRQLSTFIGRPVVVGFLSAARPTVAEAVARVRLDPGAARVVISTYLLAPGFFADQVAVAGSDLVAQPLLLPEEPPAAELVDLVAERYATAAAGL